MVCSKLSFGSVDGVVLDKARRPSFERGSGFKFGDQRLQDKKSTRFFMRARSERHVLSLTCAVMFLHHVVKYHPMNARAMHA